MWPSSVVHLSRCSGYIQSRNDLVPVLSPSTSTIVPIPVVTDKRRVGMPTALHAKNTPSDKGGDVKESTPESPSAFDQVASKGLAGVLAIAAAEAIFWALGRYYNKIYRYL